MCAVSAEAVFGSQQPALPMPHRAGPLTPYWASLAGSLTRLDLQFDGYDRSVGGATILPLSQLTRLQSLCLRFNCWSADVDLSLPQLQKLEIVAIQHVCITLMCSQLKTLDVMSGSPLGAFDGIPPGIQGVSFHCYEDGSLPLHKMLWGRKLDQLRSLTVSMSPRSYESPVASEVIKQVLKESKLTALATNCPLEQLVASTGPQSALPTSLQHLILDLPLERGISNGPRAAHQPQEPHLERHKAGSHAS